MKKSNIKQKIIIGAIILLLILAIGFFSASKEVQKSISTKTVPSPVIPKRFDGGLSITSLLKSKDFNFPKSLPLLKISPRFIDETKSTEIANNIGFNSAPLIANDTSEGIKYVWSESDKYLIVTAQAGAIEYGQNTPQPPSVSNKQLNDKEIISIAQQFLTDNHILDSNKFEFSYLGYLKSSSISEGFEKTTKENSSLTQVVFNYKVANRPIFTLYPDKPSIFVQVLPDGSIYGMQSIVFDAISETEEKYSLLNFNEVTDNLNHAILINLLNDYMSISNLDSKAIQSIEIDSISLVYLIDSPSSNKLQPVYLLSGKAKVSGSTADYAQLYLPAIKN